MRPADSDRRHLANESLVAAGYDAVYGAHSETLQALWREHACGADYPNAFEHISFLTLAELTKVSELLSLDERATLVDLACGAGGPGLWLARSAGAAVVGVDLSTRGLARARQRAAAVAMVDRSTFVPGSFASTGLDDHGAHAVVSIDALQYAPDKSGALAEAKRLLAPGGRFVFTAFEVIPDRVAGLPVLGDDPVVDFRPLLEQAGFDVDHYEETPGWRARVTATYRSILGAEDVLVQELGIPVYTSLAWEMALTLERDFYRRRVLVAARSPRRARPIATRSARLETLLRSFGSRHRRLPADEPGDSRAEAE